MKNMSGKTKSAMNESINSLKMKRDRFEDKLNEMEQSTEENWTRMRNELDESATELDRTYDAFDKEYSIKR
jgi:archaellum component FlaC